MVVDYLSMSSVNFAMPDFCSVIQRQHWPAIFGPGYTAATLFKRHGAASCSFKMISFSNINKQYGKQLLFVDASFQLNPGEKVGLVGPNGSGKTTLFRMVVGEETPDEGAVSVPRKLTIGYFRQDVEEMQGRSVLDEAIAGSGRVGDLHHELEALQREMSDPDRPMTWTASLSASVTFRRSTSI
jgi:ATPase subunit of ABC transporter with duplicated ATPase domains